jgi:ATP-dependent helicase Lhr and Lhr-like helicase
MDAAAPPLPESFTGWFNSRGWQPRAHQLELLAAAAAGRSTLLVAPTGAGKTLAGFLPSLVELAMRENNGTGQGNLSGQGLHTLYISPLKALAVDIARNLEAPVREMALPITLETRTGDTSPARRARQMARPPDILLTTPEQLALMVSHRDARRLFGGLKRIVLDELHSLTASKRGDLMALDLARLKAIAPGAMLTGLSATVREPEVLARYLVFRPDERALIVEAPPGAAAHLSVLNSARVLPLAGHSARHALTEIHAAIGAHRLTLVFVNTRMQAELMFHELWRLNDANWPIALHHGSLDAAQRRKVEGAMAGGRLKAVICTSTLDLGIDWGDVDLVVNIGAPKGASRLMQRIGRANHRLDEPSKAYLVPANRFEVMECRAALDAVAVAAQDTPDARKGALDVLAQHVLGVACSEGFEADALYAEVVGAAPYNALTRAEFDAILNFVATGGYALKAYERFAKIVKGKDGRWRATHARVIQQYRMNVGTIVESTMLKVRLGRGKSQAGKPLAGKPGVRLSQGGKVLGEIEEYFAESMLPGDTFLFAGEVLRFEGINENNVLCSRTTAGTDPKIPSYAGGKFPLSSFLAARVRAMIADPARWAAIGGGVEEWLQRQARKSVIPKADEMLAETFARAGRFYLVAYPFEGRLAHQTLGMLLTRRLERARMKPLGFVCTDYGIAVWGLADLSAAIARGALSLDELFAEDMLGDDLEDWLAESALMKRTFRACAVIAGLIERRFPGQEKNGRQVTMSSDLVYDVLRQHEPDHVLLRAARDDAATGLLDIGRVGQMLSRIRGRIIHKELDHVSPLAVSVMLEIGREAVHGEAADEILAEAEAMMLDEAMA